MEGRMEGVDGRPVARHNCDRRMECVDVEDVLHDRNQRMLPSTCPSWATAGCSSAGSANSRLTYADRDNKANIGRQYRQNGMAFLESALSILGNSGSNEHNLRDLEACADKLVPFVGAGLSAAFDYPGWKGFLQGLAKGSPILAEVDRLLSKDQYEEAAETLENYLKEKFNEAIRDTFDNERIARPLRKGAVRYLPNIARGPVITTNFDGILEAAFTDAGKDFTGFYPGNRIRDANQAIQLRRRALLKLHGDFRDPYSRVLTLDEYSRAYGPAKSGQIQWDLPVPRVLQQAIGGNPLLFLGCSLVTDRTTAIIAQVARDLPGIQHFALLSASENTPDRCLQLAEWRVRPLFFPAGQFGKIEEFLACLAGFLTPKKRTAPSTVTRQYLTSFVGREGELSTLKTLLLEGSRLVTVTGPAGCGKTRLAVEAAEALRSEFTDGVYFVPLDEIDKPELVLPEIGRQLDIRETADEERDPAGTSETKPRSKTLQRTLEEYLRERQVLLVLDNFEHVIEAARSIAVLASAGNQLSILVTSRERLHVQGEYEVNIDPLMFPDPDHLPDAASLLKYSAVELFSSRAQGTVRGFAVTPQNSRAVATICQKLDGLPLAIELRRGEARLLLRRVDGESSGQPADVSSERSERPPQAVAKTARLDRLESRTARYGRAEAVPPARSLCRELRSLHCRGGLPF